jgi:CCR4-NOT transcription complex subunit 6
MFNQGHGHQGHNVMMNGGRGHQGFGMQMNLGKPFQHNQNHQHHGHGHQQHQEHAGGAHGGPYNHQHNISSGGMSNVQPHFGTGHMQNGTPNSVHSGLSKPPNEHWAEQLHLAQNARGMTQSHSHARNQPNVSKSVVGGTTNGMQKETDKEERNRPTAQGAEDAKDHHIWTILDFGGQSLKVITPTLFSHYKFLTKLYVNCNKLTYVHPSIGQLRSLTHLDLSLNQLHFLPPEIGMLTNLKQLLVFDNALDTLPYEIGSLYQLEMLGIEGNPIPDDLKQIIMEQGTTELIKHFRETAPGPDTPPDRDWIVLDEIQDPTQETVSALSYNILCDKYCTQSQYGYTPSTVLAWEYRRELILGEIRQRNADIVCLQEIDQDSFNEFFREKLAHDDYKGVFWPKTRARTMSERDAKLVDGCAIFYKNSK